MSDVKHTPETWWVEADHRDGRGIVGYDVLAKGRCIVGCEGIDGSEQGLKDATLIAAAPCMLAPPPPRTTDATFWLGEAAA